MVHQKRSQVATWANDTLVEEPKKEKSKPVADYLNFDSDESEDLSEEEKDGSESFRDEEETRGTKMDYHPLLGFVLVNGRANMLMEFDLVSCLQTVSVIRRVVSPTHNSLCALWKCRCLPKYGELWETLFLVLRGWHLCFLLGH